VIVNEVVRHLTAMGRSALSRPVALALSNGLLHPTATFFDYGCGRGGDLQRLSTLGYAVAGWDPAHHPQGERRAADVVNLGYVVNVIENATERADALRAAWSLARQVLVVSARPDWEGRDVPGRPYGDGILTGKGTFQKFFAQDELRSWIDNILGTRSIAAAPGIFYVFRDDVQAQSFLAARIRHRPAAAKRPRVRSGRSGRPSWMNISPSRP
jgi:DNA phosphorothioation-associated putative methyltransferase